MSRKIQVLIWLLVAGVFAGALVLNTQYWRKKVRALEAKYAKKLRPVPAFDKRDVAYFRELARLANYQFKPPFAPSDAARLSAYDRIELNKALALASRNTPATLPGRKRELASRTTVPLAPDISVKLAAPFSRYQYELVNKSERALPMPILFQDIRWDSAAALVEKAGFKNIPDETDRALAIWQFVCANRVFADPPTEGKEEHDVIKFLSLYGYGYCDDTARAVTTLAELCGLRGRVWHLEGHLVSEIQLGGRWRMLDADQQAYFHRSSDPRDILGVEELNHPSDFEHMVFFAGTGEYARRYMDCIATKQNNRVDIGGTAQHQIQPVLRPGERLTMTNYNWGRYFLGRFPSLPPGFQNGYFTYFFHPRDLVVSRGRVNVEPIEGGYRLENPVADVAVATIELSYPFPIVGGLISASMKVKGYAGVHLDDTLHDRIMYAEPSKDLSLNLDQFVGVLASEPTYRYKVVFNLESGAQIELRDFVAISDIQFAPMALLRLQTGENQFHMYLPEGSDMAAFELRIDTE